MEYNFFDGRRRRSASNIHNEKGNIFAVDVIKEIILDSDKLKKLLEGKPECTDAYIEIFGMPEEA